jgi:hypothetical protein
MARLTRRELLMILIAGTTLTPLYLISTLALAQEEEQVPEEGAPAESTPPAFTERGCIRWFRTSTCRVGE